MALVTRNLSPGSMMGGTILKRGPDFVFFFFFFFFHSGVQELPKSCGVRHCDGRPKITRKVNSHSVAAPFLFGEPKKVRPMTAKVQHSREEQSCPRTRISMRKRKNWVKVSSARKDNSLVEKYIQSYKTQRRTNFSSPDETKRKKKKEKRKKKKERRKKEEGSTPRHRKLQPTVCTYEYNVAEPIHAIGQ